MKLAMVGFGQAGGKILDKFIEEDEEKNHGIVRAAVAVNTAETDLMGLERVPESNQVLIGQSQVKGHGVGADNEKGAEIAEADMDEIQNTIDNIPVHEVDAFLIIAALGGGTGSGGAPVLAKHLQRIYTEPVYGLGVLPSANEGGIYSLNAAQSFRTFVEETDNLLVFDNDAWRQTGESIEAGYEDINQEIVKRFSVLLGAGEATGGEEIGESVVDSSEIINTLAGGGVSTVGYADELVEDEGGGGIISRFRGDDERDTANSTNRVMSLIRKSALGRLTLPCELGGIERALVVTAGPPALLDRKGIEKGSRWLEEETGSRQVRGGDYPIPGAGRVASVVLLSGVVDCDRIRELQETAIEANDRIEEREEKSEANLRDLVEDDEDEIDPLF
jgi:cell division GTPase FtsZ